MRRCPITYEIIDDHAFYSERGLRLLSPNLTELKPLEFSANEQRAEALKRVGKMSIQGMQPKLSAQLKVAEKKFSLVDQYGSYILKPPSNDYPELPENEALTMSLAAIMKIEVPLHGLIYSKDNSMTYFIKRFDRKNKSRIAIEDFAQLSGHARDTKYNSTMENVVKIIKKYCSFPQVEAVKLFRLTLFNFLIGNEDMHLKNLSVITRGNKITLSPAYDLLNTTIAQAGTQEELALWLNGRKKNLKKKDFLDYFAKKHLELNQNIINKILSEIESGLPACKELIMNSFLSKKMQEKYLLLLEERWEKLIK